MSKRRLGPGVWVRSAAVGDTPAFVGQIVRRHAGAYNAWEVRCHEGWHWHRTASELTVVKPPEVVAEAGLEPATFRV